MCVTTHKRWRRVASAHVRARFACERIPASSGFWPASALGYHTFAHVFQFCARFVSLPPSILRARVCVEGVSDEVRVSDSC